MDKVIVNQALLLEDVGEEGFHTPMNRVKAKLNGILESRQITLIDEDLKRTLRQIVNETDGETGRFEDKSDASSRVNLFKLRHVSFIEF